MISSAAVDDFIFNFTQARSRYTRCSVIEHNRSLIPCGAIRELPKEKLTIVEVSGLELTRGMPDVVSELCKGRSEGMKVSHR